MRLLNRSPFKVANKAVGYRIENKADETTMYLYDEIGYWGVSAQQFVKDLDAVKSKTLHLRINSPGGSVFDGTSMYNALRQHPASVIVHIDGLAASIASIIALAGNEIRMSENAFFMIHEPWSMVVGSSEDMRKEAELLDKVRGMIAATYMKKSGKEEKEILELMADETWMTSEEAVAMGFVDAVDADDVEKNEVVLFDLSVFAKVPEKLQNKNEKGLTAKEIETALRNGGCTQKQAKAIISEGFKPGQRNVAEIVPKIKEEDQRDVASPVQAKGEDQRDVASPEQVKAGSVDELIIRATLLLSRTI